MDEMRKAIAMEWEYAKLIYEDTGKLDYDKGFYKGIELALGLVDEWVDRMHTL